MDASSYVKIKPNRNIPSFRPGDTVRVHARVVEGERERIQVFEGVVLRKKRGGINSMFTVRRVSHGIGVERVFPMHSPLIDKVEVVRVGRVRRARLYYLRERIGKSARIRVGSRERFEELAAELAAGAAAIDEEELEEDTAEEAEEGGAEAEAGEEGAEAEASEEEESVAESAEEAPAAEAEDAPEAEEEPAPEAEEASAAEEEPAAESDVEEVPAAEEAPAEESAAEVSEEVAEDEAESGEEPGEATEEPK